MPGWGAHRRVRGVRWVWAGGQWSQSLPGPAPVPPAAPYRVRPAAWLVLSRCACDGVDVVVVVSASGACGQRMPLRTVLDVLMIMLSLCLLFLTRSFP